MNILLADDHKLVLEALHVYLTRLKPDISIVKAINLKQAVERVAEEESIDLVILDLNMPGMNGLQGLGVMQRACQGVPVVLMSGETDPMVVREALKRGAAGFVPKDLSGRAMLRALELVVSGDTYVPSLVVRQQNASDRGSKIKPRSARGALTKREQEVLSLLVKGKSNKHIADALEVKEGTVAFHLKSIFRKMNVSSRTEAVTKALRLGCAA